MDPVQLSKEQMAELAGLIATQMKGGAPDDDTTEVKPKVTKSVAPTAEEIGDAVLAKIQQNSGADNKKIFDTLWKEKLDTTLSSVPGLDDFINGEDDYGHVRNDKLNAIEDYNDRLSALKKLTKSYNEASAGQAGRRPVINKAAQQKAKESEDMYGELIKKQKAGEYTSAQEMADDFFAAFDKEKEGLV